MFKKALGVGAALLVSLMAGCSGPAAVTSQDPPKEEEATPTVSLQAVYSPGSGSFAPVTFAWVDARTGGARLSVLDGRDDAYTTVSLPFPFPWGGKAVSSLEVSTNGVVTAGGEGTTAFTNYPLPYAGRNRFAPVFWDDLYNDCSQGGIFVKTLTSGGQPTAFVVSWEHLRHYGGGSCSGQGPVSFQAIFYPDGRILYQFRDTDFGKRSWNAGASATVGLQGAPDGYPQAYALWSYNTPVVASGTALLYTPPQAIRGVSRGTLSPLCRLPNAYEGAPYGPVSLYGPTDVATLPAGMTKTPFRGGVNVDGTPDPGTGGQYVLAEPRTITGGCFLRVEAPAD